MDIRLKITLTIILLMSILYIILTIKNKKLAIKYGVFWTIVFILFIFMIIFPNILDIFTKFLGFEKGSNMLFLVGYFVLMYFVFSLYLTVSKLADENRKLIQELSLLKYEIERRKQK